MRVALLCPTKRSVSVMEQGELEASPDGRSSSPAGRQSQPRSSHTPDYKPDPEEEDEAGDDASHERQDDNEDGLDIKPPQVQANRKDRHKHKHREDRKRDKERDKLNRNRERQSKVKPHEHEREKPPKERRDDRDPGRREHEKQQEKEAEAKRREKSNRERERLERLERERHRLEREHKERLQLEQERLLRAERERERLDKAERQSRQRGHDGDSRSGRRQPPLPPATRHDVERRRAKDKPAYANRDRRVPDVAAAADRGRRGVEPSAERLTRRVVIESVVERERPRSRSPVHSSKDRYDRDRREDARYRKGFRDQDLQRHRQTEVVDLLEEEDDEDERPHQLSSVPSKVQKFPPDEPVLVDEDLGEEGEHSGSDTERESETDTDSASDSESESGESGSSSEHLRSHRQHHGEAAEAEEQEDQDDMEHMHHSPDKYRSKFDDAPEEEEMDEQEDDLDLEDTDLDSPRPSEADDEANYIEDLPPESPVELKPDLPPYLPAIQGCRNVEEFHCLNRIEEGTYGVVYRARDKKTDQIVALKRLKMEKEKEGFPITSLREINTLLKSQHNNIVTVREIVVGSNMDKIYIVMDYVEHDLKSLMETMKEPFMIGEVKTLLRQLLKGVAHLHDNWIIHRDLKTSNLLLSHAGILKIGDFGLAREYGSPLKHYTPIVVTLWYRAPELLLGTKKYSTPIDMWSVGCIFAEFLTKKPLFPGKSEIDELNRIFKELGTPNEKIWPGVGELPAMKKCTFTEYPYNQLRNRFGSLLTDKGFDLLNTFLTYNPERRISAEDALKHDYYQESPKPIDTSMFPTWPAKSEMPRRQSGGNSPRPPSGGKAYDRLMGEDDDVQGFHMSTAAKGAAACGPGFSLKF